MSVYHTYKNTLQLQFVVKYCAKYNKVYCVNLAVVVEGCVLVRDEIYLYGFRPKK